MTSNRRRRRSVENDEYGAFVRRVLRAYSRRVADGDIEALILMTSLADELDTPIAKAAHLRLLLGRVGSRLGITRQAAQQRRGTTV